MASNDWKDYFVGQNISFGLVFAFVTAILLAGVFYFGPPSLVRPLHEQGTNLVDELFEKRPRRLDGLMVDRDKVENQPVAIVIGNSEDSLPQDGLSHASVVYEVPVESSITRLLAIFSDDIRASSIGTVRSLRPYTLELAEEWQAVLFHAGGSPQSLEQLARANVLAINEISGDGIYFRRDPNREAPHNLFIDSSLIERAFLAKGIDAPANFAGWLFKDGDSLAARNNRGNFTERIDIDFGHELSRDIRFRYNLANNNYTRIVDDQVVLADGKQLTVDNVIVQQVPIEVIDSIGRVDIDLDGFGKAELYLDGRVTIGTWEKQDGRTYFFDETGTEVRLNRGRTWVAIVPGN